MKLYLFASFENGYDCQWLVFTAETIEEAVEKVLKTIGESIIGRGKEILEDIQRWKERIALYKSYFDKTPDELFDLKVIKWGGEEGKEFAIKTQFEPEIKNLEESIIDVQRIYDMRYKDYKTAIKNAFEIFDLDEVVNIQHWE